MRHVRIQITQPRTNDMSLFYLLFYRFFLVLLFAFTFFEKKKITSKKTER